MKSKGLYSQEETRLVRPTRDYGILMKIHRVVPMKKILWRCEPNFINFYFQAINLTDTLHKVPQMPQGNGGRDVDYYDSELGGFMLNRELHVV